MTYEELATMCELPIPDAPVCAVCGRERPCTGDHMGFVFDDGSHQRVMVICSAECTRTAIERIVVRGEAAAGAIRNLLTQVDAYKNALLLIAPSAVDIDPSAPEFVDTIRREIVEWATDPRTSCDVAALMRRR